MTERTIPATTHGRYLVVPPSTPGPFPMLVGFHGYAEGAEAHLDRLRTIGGIDRWLVVAVQGLHRFYRGRSNDVVASWMTRQDRELAMADNLAYTTAVVEAVSREWPVGEPIVFAGFSQGVAMTFRAAAALRGRVAGVIALGGDVPPELDAAALGNIPAALIGRGIRDDWYTSEKLAADEPRLRAAGVAVQTIEFDGAHEWLPAFSDASARFLEHVVARRL